MQIQVTASLYDSKVSQQGGSREELLLWDPSCADGAVGGDASMISITVIKASSQGQLRTNQVSVSKCFIFLKSLEME